MKSFSKSLAVGALALMICVPAAFAQTPEGSILPVTEPLDVGGPILQPGTYLIRVLPSPTDRNKVQITSQDGQTVFATVLTVPRYLKPGEEIANTTFVFYPPVEGAPRALRTWYAQDPSASGGGHDIVYDERRARELARLASLPVVSYRQETQVSAFDDTDLFLVTPDQRIKVYVPPPPMVSAARVAEAAPLQMPRTASRLPLVAMLGLLSIAGALAFRVIRPE